MSLLLLFNFLLIKRIELTSIICSGLAIRELYGDEGRGGDRNHDECMDWWNLTSGNAGGEDGSEDTDTEMTVCDGEGGHGGQLLRGRDGDRRGEDDMDAETVNKNKVKKIISPNTTRQFEQGINMSFGTGEYAGLSPRIIFDEAATEMYKQMSVTDSVYHGCSPFSKFIVFVRACAVHSSII